VGPVSIRQKSFWLTFLEPRKISLVESELTPSQTLSNLLGGMLLIQVVLGGASLLISDSYFIFHLIWGILTFAVLIALTAVTAKSMGTKSITFKLSIAVIIDFVIQGLLGFTAMALNSNQFILVHLTNAFILIVLASMLISYNRALAPIAASAKAASAPTSTSM
jgi:hypothetical protein